MIQMMKWISALLFLVVAQSAFASEVPVSIIGPVPALPSVVYPGFAQVEIFTITNNVPKVLPLSVTGLSDEYRVAVANDCGNQLPKGRSTCNVGVEATAPYGVSAGMVDEDIFLDYQGRAPLVGNISFTILPVLSITGSPLSLFNGQAGAISVTNVSPSIVAQGVTAVFTGTALQGNATVTHNTCTPNLAPGASCLITITAGNSTVASTNFNIEGTNTEAETAAMSVTALTVGESYDGGIVGCSTASGNSINLIAATTDIASLSSSQLDWSPTTGTTNATSPTMGQSNTNLIVAAYPSSTAYAAAACANYEVDSAGNTPCISGNTCYDSWYLPSLDELECVAGNYTAIGSFDNTQDYWSSTEVTAANADAINLTMPSTPISSSKGTVLNVRCTSQPVAQ
jgi:hypothetical protein